MTWCHVQIGVMYVFMSFYTCVNLEVQSGQLNGIKPLQIRLNTIYPICNARPIYILKKSLIIENLYNSNREV